MSSLRSTLDRVIPALLMALGVTLVFAGLLSLNVAPVVGEQPLAIGSPGASAEPGSPLDTPGPDRPSPSGLGETPIIASLPPTPTPVGGSPSPSAGMPTPTGSTGPSSRPTLPSGEVVVASRVRVPSLRIDLPVVSGELEVPGNLGGYPLCDVAQYLVTGGFSQPYEPGTTYLYSHARAGNFLPLLEASHHENGAAMLGALVQVYTTDGRVWLYEIFQVKRHATDFSLAFDVPDGEQRLVLQTSEGPSGHIPKLQVAGRLIRITRVSSALANPEPKPRVCA